MPDPHSMPTNVAARRCGFNFQWIFSWREGAAPQPPDPAALDFMAHFGLNFARIPADYRFWTKDFRYFAPDETVFGYLDQYLAACRQRNIQMCLNLHRAPGYCVNRNELERHNLWVDREAQDAFVFLWETFARRYRGVPGEALSFNLLNEPPHVGRCELTRENHAEVMRRSTAAIRAIDPQREIVIDGLACGGEAIPELADLGAVHSGRGYQPMPVTHYQASWWAGSQGLPPPVYPGTPWAGRAWDKSALLDFYRPWREVEQSGVRVHIGEFGCFNKTPNDVALRWYRDVISIYRGFGWGYALWNFKGAFGIVEHGREGARWELIHGFRVDRELLDLFLAR